ncbi:MAG: hypothetical protein IKV32_06310 [Muribaculaceae bacterium]|nr:hypothetical protein [Muribaculaceae bacterium]
MKKINLILGALVCLFAFSACTEEVEYTPATPDKGVYFPSTLPTQVNLSMEDSVFNVQILRTDTVGEQTIALQVETTDEAGVFTFPETVTFADGAQAADITIAYDAEKLGYNFEDITLSVDPTLASAYGGNAYAFSAGIPEPWKSLGYATFSDAFFFYDTYQVEVQQNELNPAQFRLVKPFHEALKVDDDGYWGGPWENTDEYLYFSILQKNSTFAGENITKDGLVYFEPFNTGWNNPSYNAEVQLLHPAHFSALATEDSWTYNAVQSYQENGLPAVVQLAPMYYMDGVGGWNHTQEDGYVTIVFPGVVIKDYSVAVEYAGRFTDPKDNAFADLNVSMGADVASVKVGMAASEDINGVLAGILNGSIESVELTAAGTARFALADAGKYTAVAVSYDAEGAPQEAAYTQFEYTVGATTSAWETLGMATYTDGFICSMYLMTPATYEVEVQANSEKPGIYRLVNPYGAAFPYNEAGDWDTSKDYYLEINAQDPQGVYIETQPLGLDWGSGMFYASSACYQLLANYDLETIKAAGGYCGTLVDGVITFPHKKLSVSDAPSEGWYYANLFYDLETKTVVDGSAPFKVVLPSSASKSSKSVKAVTNRVRADKKNVAGQRLKKMDRQIPQAYNKK